MGPSGYKGQVGKTPPPIPCILFLVCVDDGVLNSETVTLQVGQAWGLHQFESLVGIPG